MINKLDDESKEKFERLNQNYDETVVNVRKNQFNDDDV